jgi:sugar lactone lactonase YvrE
VLFTSYLAKEIIRYAPGAGAATFARIDAHPISILPLGEGWLVAAHGEPFVAGPGFTATNRFLMLDTSGNVIRTIPAPEARFLNGMAMLDDGRVLAADSILGRIWQLDIASGKLAPWLDDAALAADPAGKDVRPGANGLKLHEGALYISNSFAGTIHAVTLGPDGEPSGPVRPVARPGRIDDFAVHPDGTIYLATHSDSVIAIGREGALRTVLPEGGDGSTAVALVPGKVPALYVLTTGGLLEGAARPARLLKVALPGGDRLCPASG